MNDYFEGYKVLYDSINTAQAILPYVKKRLESLSCRSEILHLLDIGCADGQKSQLFVELVQSIRPDQSIHMHLVEPSQRSLDQAYDRLKPLVKEISCSCMTLDEILEKPCVHDFDWIIAGNVFYHADIKALDQLVQKTSSDGMLMILMGGQDYPLEVHDELRKISFGDSSIVHEHLKNSSVLQAFHVEVDQVPTFLNLKGLYTVSSGLTADGEKLISMLYRIPYDRFSEKQKNVLDRLLLDAVTNHNGKVTHYHDLFWINKLT